MGLPLGSATTGGISAPAPLRTRDGLNFASMGRCSSLRPIWRDGASTLARRFQFSCLLARLRRSSRIGPALRATRLAGHGDAHLHQNEPRLRPRAFHRPVGPRGLGCRASSSPGMCCRDGEYQTHHCQSAHEDSASPNGNRPDWQTPVLTKPRPLHGKCEERDEQGQERSPKHRPLQPVPRPAGLQERQHAPEPQPYATDR